MSDDPNFIRCRFCAWTTAKWRQNKDGEQKGPASAFYRLKEHIEGEHPDQFDEIWPTEATL